MSFSDIYVNTRLTGLELTVVQLEKENKELRGFLSLLSKSLPSAIKDRLRTHHLGAEFLK